MNKITYPSEMLMSNAIDVSCERIETLREAVKEETNDIVINALQMEIKAERNAVQKALSWVTIN